MAPTTARAMLSFANTQLVPILLDAIRNTSGRTTSMGADHEDRKPMRKEGEKLKRDTITTRRLQHRGKAA